MIIRSIHFLFLLLLLWGCESAPKDEKALSSSIQLEGKTMGTYYKVTYLDPAQRNFQEEIDQLLQEINQEVSTYIPNSTISTINQSEHNYSWPEDQDAKKVGHFMRNFDVAKKVFRLTEGNFDPTVMPLVNYWGFGYTEKKPVTDVDRKIIDSLMNFVGFDKVELSNTDNHYQLTKQVAGVQLDFSACAKGDAVDELGRLLETKGIQDYLVDIGGEARAKGLSPRGDHWRIGINIPKEDAPIDAIQVAVPLVNQAIATSGNYRNFYEVEGVKYSHTINPKTGFPERSQLLSTSVFAADCITADAFATAFMVMGHEKAMALATRLPEVEAYFIVSQPDGSLLTDYTPGLKSLFQE